MAITESRAFAERRTKPWRARARRRRRMRRFRAKPTAARNGGERKSARGRPEGGANGLFIETHPQPDAALSDGPNMIPLGEMKATLRGLLKVFEAVQCQTRST